MKARVKATDRIIEVMCVMGIEGKAVWEDISGISTCANQYTSDELEFLDFPIETRATSDPDYWTRLEHTYAGMAMQGILSNQTHTKHLLETSTSAKDARDIIVGASRHIAHALVQKMKEERK